MTRAASMMIRMLFNKEFVLLPTLKDQYTGGIYDNDHLDESNS